MSSRRAEQHARAALVDERIGSQRLRRLGAARLAHEDHVVEERRAVDPLVRARQRRVRARARRAAAPATCAALERARRARAAAARASPSRRAPLAASARSRSPRAKRAPSRDDHHQRPVAAPGPQASPSFMRVVLPRRDARTNRRCARARARPRRRSVPRRVESTSRTASERAVAIEHRHDDLRERERRVAGDVPGKLLDVVDDDGAPLGGRRAAHAACRRRSRGSRAIPDTAQPVAALARPLGRSRSTGGRSRCAGRS